MLSFIKQLASEKNNVILNFTGGFCATMRYLYRMNFFKGLDDNVCVYPELNNTEDSKHYGKNNKVVEIEPITIDADYDESLHLTKIREGDRIVPHPDSR